MRVDVSQSGIGETGAELLVVGLYEEGKLPAELAAAPGAADAKGSSAVGLTPAGSGRAIITTPARPHAIHALRLQPISSPSNVAERSATKIGETKTSVVASAIGMRCTAAMSRTVAATMQVERRV